MSETATLLAHYSNILVGERLLIGFLLIVIIGMFVYREKRLKEQEKQLAEIQRLNELFKETQSHAIRNLLDNVIKNDKDYVLIDNLVEIVGKYFNADRSYVFERDVTGQYTVNTYEWCAEGVSPEKDNLQEVPINVVDPWIDEFRKKGTFYISCDDEYARKEPMVYEVLEPQGITSLMAAPMAVNGDIIGFIGVDNPKENLEHELYLAVAATAINHERQIVLERQQEAAYKQKLEQQLDVIDATSQRYFCTYTFDLNNNTFNEVFTIPNMHELLGSQGDAEKPLDLAWRRLVVPEDQALMRDFHDISRWNEYLEDKDVFSVEYRGVTSGWSKATLFAAKREDGRVTSVVYTLEKIHAQKEIEDMLSKQLEEIASLNKRLTEKQQYTDTLYHKLLQIQACGIVAYKLPSREVLVMNNLAKKMYGLSIEGAIDNEELIDHIAKVEYDKPEETLAKLRNIKNPGDRCSFSMWTMDSEGVKNHLFVTTQLTQMDNGDTVIVSSLLDITAVTMMERLSSQATAENAAKTAFLFNMSHDIRTPMNAIIGFRDLLEKHQEDPEKRRDYLNKIEEASNVLLSIINNVLEMARIEKGSIEIDESAWSAEQFNDTLYSIFHEMMSEKGISFTRKIEVEHPYVYCDPIKLREVFINILSNAYKYTNSGGSVYMHLKEIPSDHEGYALYQTTITDTGIGMSEAFLPHLFEEFSRENNTTDNKVEGTGLGMPIVKRLIEFMNGSVEVKSVKGEGTTFIVTIPHKIAERSSLVEHVGVEVDPMLFEGKRVLLAEDNEFNAEIAIEMLEEAGFIIERAEDGQICCEMLTAAPENYYDLILMDIQMPNMNGYDATKAIRNMQDSVKANIPIIAMTANAFEEDKREAFRVGMNGHIAKPVKVIELMKILVGILS